MKNCSFALQDANSVAIRKGTQTPFCTLKCLWDYVLKTSYPILYVVCENQNATVPNIQTWNNNN
jgi:hypothetical protein